MDTNWATEHLQVIRTLMERTALYRRALAPIMLLAGATGLAGSASALFLARVESNRAFACLWLGVAAITLVLSYLIARRQALKDDEPFWSPPTRRVTRALVPGFLAGGAAGALALLAEDKLPDAAWLLAPAWVTAYGCALHAAGFFMERGIKLFGLALVALGALALVTFGVVPSLQTARAAHVLMGLVFGAGHLGYGAYLHLTEKRSRA
jgi:hypothetical protein